MVGEEVYTKGALSDAQEMLIRAQLELDKAKNDLKNKLTARSNEVYKSLDFNQGKLKSLNLREKFFYFGE
jgi:DNA relaxase NicK